MSQDDFGAASSQKAGMGSGLKIFLILLAVFGGFAVLCCGGAMYFFYSIGSSVSEDPTTVEQVRAEIADIAIPPDFKPAGSMNYTLPVGDQHMKFVIYKGPQEPTMLMLMSMNIAGATAEQIQAQMEQQLERQGVQHGGHDVQVEQTEEREFVINDKPAKFFFGQGKDEKNQADCWQVVGSFEGQAGPTGFILVANKDSMTEEQITQMIESIK